MSKLKNLFDKYHPVILRAANIIDMARAGGMVPTPAQEAFIAETIEFTRLTAASAPEFVIIAVLESVHEQAQAVIAEVNS